VYPFSFLLRLIPSKNLKHLLSCVGGVVLVQWVFGPDWAHAFVSSSVTYLLCLIVPRKYCAQVVFLWVMGYMTAAHLYRMWVSYLTGVFDFTGTQMVLTMKLTSFAYNLYDGTYDKKNVFGTHSDKAAAKVYANRKKFAIEKLPNLLEYFGYIFCFTCILAGPAFEYTDYISAIDGSVYQDPSKKDQKSSKTPSSLLPSFVKFSIGVLFLIGYVVGSGHFRMSTIYDPSFISSSSFLYRCAFLYLALAASRCKYYFVWMMAEGGSNLAGFGFEGYDKEGRVIGWEGVKNIDIIGFETASCIQHLSRAWNKRTQGWLERYTYLRCGRSLLVTYFVSAFWHGLYPGFFIFFMTIPLYTNFERLARAKLNPLLAPGYDGYNYATYPKTAVSLGYWFICWLCNNLVINYTVQVSLIDLFIYVCYLYMCISNNNIVCFFYVGIRLWQFRAMLVCSS